MIAPVMFLCRCPFKPIVFYRCGHVISRSMHHGPPNASRNMSSPIPYGTHPLHQAFPHISFASTVQKVGRFRRLSPNDGIFHEAENGEKSQTRDFDGPYLAIGLPDRRSTGAVGDGEGRTHWDDKWQAGMVPHKTQKEGFITRTSQVVSHPSTTLAQARLTAEF